MTAKVSKKNSFSTLSYQVLWLGSGIRLPRTIPLGPENFKIGLPPIDRQKQFAEIYVQADKSEFDSLRSECELELLIKAINSVIKSLI